MSELHWLGFTIIFAFSLFVGAVHLQRWRDQVHDRNVLKKEFESHFGRIE